MNKLERYFSLLKFSIINPKAGVEIMKTEKQVRKDSKNEILEFGTNSKKLEEIINELFPKIEFSMKDFYEKTESLRNHINLFYKKLNDEKFPSKEKPYPTDYSVPINSGLLLYIICKVVNPKKIVETGVAYGHSSCFILEALSENNSGKLFSIDSIFRPWETKEKIGSMIPNKLKINWEMNFGTSKNNLKKLLDREKEIDIFIHDSLHTYDNMIFEFETVWKYIKKNGFLISDDISGNNAFYDFCKKNNLKPLILKQDNGKGLEMGIIIKK
ncbi:MAG: hypothetical protein CXT78_04100 [Thaumarchaeota archaeon]|nr:MAG: hypothetical protein CXT78_04100 [Nitrososphaerota archaeon]